MAVRATEMFIRHNKEHKLDQAQCQLIDDNTEYVRTVDESIELNAKRFPCIIVSASGMGWARASSPENTVAQPPEQRCFRGLPGAGHSRGFPREGR